MKLSSLVIAPQDTWRDLGPNNPLRAVVKLDAEHSSVECVLSEASMMKMLDLCADEIARQAKKNVEDFARAVTAIEGDKAPALLGEQ